MRIQKRIIAATYLRIDLLLKLSEDVLVYRRTRCTATDAFRNGENDMEETLTVE